MEEEEDIKRDSVIFLDNQLPDQEEAVQAVDADVGRDTNRVHPCTSLVSMQPIRPDKKKYYSLQIFQFGSISAASSNSSLEDSVPLLDDSDTL